MRRLFLGKFVLIEHLFLTMSFIAAHLNAIPPAPFPEGHSLNPSLSKSPSISSWQSVDFDRSIIENVERPGTPFVKCISSICLPDNQSNKTLEQFPSVTNFSCYHCYQNYFRYRCYQVVFAIFFLSFMIQNSFYSCYLL